MKVESKKLRASARRQDCTLRLPGVCNGNPETTVLAHLPCGQKGMGMKSPDNMAIFSCANCHDAIDGRRNDVQVEGADLLRALAETQNYWIAKGLITIK